ncbi:Ccw12p [Lachancea thermotolerans CBS 6340]|uniref:KLTH0G12760p n=1 Tax=Lachancea thermotolerans (strain ATCC 56472 / CBS 6340 / NRRL Y-8284) TaxID=559295 RepID=C5DMY9_LACTC|nr:KLTH0G12760p [Lachancea thermotolerans CBS 6340]CAR25150.1 KLTH0G12760p [Lachancea thermotolerans CBS 6340]
MQFSTAAAVATVTAVVAATNTTTVHSDSTTLVTITSCEEHACSESVSPALVSTATVTVNDVVTKYTTWCPLPTTAAPSSSNGTKTEAPASSTASVTSYTGAAAKALPAAGALVAGAAALLL